MVGLDGPLLVALGMLLSLVLPLVLVGVVVWALLRRPVVAGEAPPSSVEPLLGRWRWVSAVITAAAVLGGLLALVVVAQTLDLGVGVLLAPAVFALVHALGQVVAQLVLGRLRGPRPEQRMAALETRAPGRYVPRWRSRLSAAGLVAVVLLSVVGWWLGDPDDQGRAGRSIRYGTFWEGGPTGGSSGPWPGSFYVLPLLLTLLALLLVSLLALRLVADRPRPSEVDDPTLAADDALRATTAGRLVSGLGIASFGSAAGIALAAAMALSSAGGEDVLGAGGLDGTTLAWVALVVALLMVGGAVASLAGFLTPARPVAAPTAPGAGVPGSPAGVQA